MVLMPRPQVRFLQCLDDVRVPHKPPKQLWGELLPITGIAVDTDHMRYTMTEESCVLLIQAIEDFWTFTRPVGNHPWRLSAIQT